MTSYLAYSGPYVVDEVRGTVEHSMAVSFFPNWRGERQRRILERGGDTLVLVTEGRSLFARSLVSVRVTWRRATPNP